MEIVTLSKYPGYTIKTDYFPYDETREIIKGVDYWWTHETRSKHKASNYQLDPSLINSIETSLTMRLHSGNFSFVYYKEQVFLFGGLKINQHHEAWIHRAATHPVLGKQHIGANSAILMPHQAKVAYERGCKSYNISFNEHNLKFYTYYKEKHYYKRRNPITGGEKFMDAFEYLGKQHLYEQEQYVARLDLTRHDIESILDINPVV